MSDEASIRTPTYRVARARVMDPATKRLALIAAGLGSALLAVVGVWSVNGHRTGGSSVPVIEPPPGPMRVKPANPGGMQLAPGDEIFAQGSGGDNSADKLAPPPETPDPQALRPSPKPVGPPPVPAPQAAPAPAATSLPPAVPPHAVPSVGTPAPATPAAKPAVTPPGEQASVQLAALPTEDAAKQQWALLQHRLSDLLHGREPAISKVEMDGHTWWRVRTGGFADLAMARGFCDQVRAKGSACDVIRP